MLTISEAQRRTELFLTGQMLEALRAVEYELPSFDTLKVMLKASGKKGVPQEVSEPWAGRMSMLVNRMGSGDTHQRQCAAACSRHGR